jgi:DNA-binding MarR family transcriptional regulator
MRYRTDMSSVRQAGTSSFTVGSMLRSAWTELIDEVFEQLAAAGFADLRPVHRPILRDVLTSNLRPSELAARLGLSKQAANDLVREFEAKGYITLEPDPDDGRAKRIIATDRGREAGDTAQAASNAVGRRWAELVGEERYAVFEGVLRTIVATTTRPPDQADPHGGRASARPALGSAGRVPRR